MQRRAVCSSIPTVRYGLLPMNFAFQINLLSVNFLRRILDSHLKTTEEMLYLQQNSEYDICTEVVVWSVMQIRKYSAQDGVMWESEKL